MFKSLRTAFGIGDDSGAIALALRSKRDPDVSLHPVLDTEEYYSDQAVRAGTKTWLATPDEIYHIAHHAAAYMFKTHTAVLCCTGAYDNYGIEHTEYCAKHRNGGGATGYTMHEAVAIMEQYGKDIYSPLSYSSHYNPIATEEMKKTHGNKLSQLEDDTIEGLAFAWNDAASVKPWFNKSNYTKSPRQFKQLMKLLQPIANMQDKVAEEDTCFYAERNTMATYAGVQSIAMTALWSTICSSGSSATQAVRDLFAALDRPERRHSVRSLSSMSMYHSYSTEILDLAAPAYRLFMMAILHEAGESGIYKEDTPHEWQQHIVGEAFAKLMHERAGVLQRFTTTMLLYESHIHDYDMPGKQQ